MQDAPITPPPPSSVSGAPEQLPSPAGELEGLEFDSLDGEACKDGSCGVEHWQQWCLGGLVTGVEFAFLGTLSEPSQSVTLTNLLTDQAYTGSTLPGGATGVRTWLGFQHAGGFGYRLGYQHIGVDRIDLDPTVPFIDHGGTAFQNTYKLRADVFDVELTQRYCLHMNTLDLSFGGRFASLKRNATALGYGTLGDVDLTGLAVGANSLAGWGFTASISGRVPFGLLWAKHHGDEKKEPHPPFDWVHSRIACCYPGLLCGWSWYWGLRGSILPCADSEAYALTEASAVVNTGPQIGAANARDQAYASKECSDTIMIGEARLGVQWETCCCCIPATFFFRTGLEYQHWETGNVYARANSFAFLHDGPDTIGGRADASAVATDGTLDLFGFFIGAGITY
jgi:hypothetical protein